ncbi:hypothetical protein ACFY2K_16455 [Kitasatospora sp. NPDC001309]|uniref:hypothetical protein n=1 Tax=Kitasatospora sp. NPDC001309 TaxID=3364013 RepID=UPI003686F035
MGILVVIEQPQQPDLLVVHATGSDPDSPGDPLPVTACGIETVSMIVDPWRPSGPGPRWYPPEHAGHV